jgi:hypothetical protein
MEYMYTGMNADGSEVSGVIDASNKADAVAKVRALGCFVTQVTQVTKPSLDMLVTGAPATDPAGAIPKERRRRWWQVWRPGTDGVAASIQRGTESCITRIEQQVASLIARTADLAQKYTEAQKHAHELELELKALDTAFAPLDTWYGRGTEGKRSLVDALVDAVTDLQSDRYEVLKLRKLAVGRGENMPIDLLAATLCKAAREIPDKESGYMCHSKWHDTTGPNWPAIELEWRKLLACSSRPATELEVENRTLRMLVDTSRSAIQRVKECAATLPCP